MAEGTGRNISARKPSHTNTPQDEPLRLPPQAVEMERAVIGALLIEREAYIEVSDMLTPKSFYDEKHELIYKAIQELAESSNPIDVLSVSNRLAENGDLMRIGGKHYLAELTQKLVSSAHIDYHSQIIKQKHIARELITFARKTQDSAFDETKDIKETLDEAENTLFELANGGQKTTYTHISPIVDKVYDKIKAASAIGDGMTGLATNFDELDKITAGWQRGDLIIIAARPAMGKTAFILSMAKNIALDNKKPVAIFSLEMPEEQLVSRILANVCSIDSNKLRTGKLEIDEWERLDKGAGLLPEAEIFIDDTPSPSIFDLQTRARRLREEHKIELIIIDYLQLMNAGGNSSHFSNRQEEVSRISRSLKGLAKTLDIPIIALSQLNREVEKRDKEDRRPQLSDLRESGAIEQDADLVCFIHRPEKMGQREVQIGRNADERVSTEGLAQIIIAKHRNGAVGEVNLRFQGEYTRFTNYDASHPFNNMTHSSKPPTAVPEPSYPNNTEMDEYGGGYSSYDLE